MHADPAGRRALMRGVAADEHAPAAIARGDVVAPIPGRDREHLVRERAARHLPQQEIRLGLAQWRIEHGEAPQFLAVHRNELAPAAGLVDHAIEARPALVVEGKQLGRAEIEVEALGNGAAAFEPDAELLADRAGRAVAADEIARTHRACSPGYLIGQPRLDTIIVLRERVEARVVVRPHGRKGLHARDEDRVEIDLRAGAGRFRRIVARVARCERRLLHAQELAPAQRVEIDEIARIAFRPDRGTHRLGDTPAAAELHVAGGDHALLRLGDRAVALLDQHAVDPAQPELAGKPQSDRPAAGDDHRCGAVAHVSVVPAKAGTHTPCASDVAPILLSSNRRWLWVPAFAGTTAMVAL